MTTSHSSARLHALDAVRAFALIAGVVLHAAMSFVPGMASTGWPIVDRSSSDALGITMYVIHMFRMTLFFTIAGFFAHLLLHRRGLRAFVANRAGRILMPLIAGWVVLFPLIAITMAWGAPATAELFPGVKAQPASISFPLAHLWFLYVLILLYVATLVVRYLVVERFDRNGAMRARIDGGLAMLVRSGLAPLVFAAPVAAALLTKSDWTPWFGIPTPDHSFVPNLPAILAFGTAFAVGWFLHRQTSLLAVLERRWLPHLAVALVATVACVRMVGAGPAAAEALAGDRLALYAGTYAVAVWAWTFGLIGAALRFFARPSRVGRYLADASYWIYLAHLPLVFLLQVGVQLQPWPWPAKFGVVLGASLAWLLASYHWFVRRTILGEMLNGPRKREASATSSHEDVLADLADAKKRFGATIALDGLSLSVRTGELVAILGPNGAGKTTAISALLGLQKLDSGTADLFGRNPEDIEARYRVGVMMQEASLAPELRVRELIALTSSYYPAPMTLDEAMTLSHTASIADRPYGKLSGGQKRLVQFALAVCGRPRLIFLDEPTVGLDIQARERLWATLRQLVAQGTSIVLTTHYLEEAETLADRVLVVAKGRLIASGTVNDLRSLVSRKQISCVTKVDADTLRAWPEVKDVRIESTRTHLLVTDADAVVRRLLSMDETARDLEIKRAGLAEAFTELTQEAA